MIEKQFVQQKMKEFSIQEYISTQLSKSGYSHIDIQRTPLGEKIIIYTTRPGIVVGKKGENIQRLTNVLKKRFKMENPQIEIGEVKEPNLDVYYVADKIVSTLERFGSKRFKSIGYRALQEVMDAGATGVEITIGGRGVPSTRAKSWSFRAGYLKKSGDINENYVKCFKAVANLKSGSIGVSVKILTPDVKLPDEVLFKAEKIKQEEVKVEVKEEKKGEVKPEEAKVEAKEEKKEETKEEKPKRATKKKAAEAKEKIKENGTNKKK